MEPPKVTIPDWFWPKLD